MRCKEKYIRTALDTSGYAPEEIFNKFIADIDLILSDLKIIDDEQNQKYTRVYNKIIIYNLKTALAAGKKTFLRLIIIPGIIDTDTHIRLMKDFVAILNGITGIDLLPYHKLTQDKYRRFNRAYKPNGISEPTKRQLNDIKLMFETPGVKVIIGG